VSTHETRTVFDGESLNEGWRDFIERVAPDARDRLQGIMLKARSGSRAAANEAMAEIMGLLLSGNIHPSIEPMLFRWMEMYLGSVAHAYLEQGTPELVPEGMRVAAIGVLEQRPARVMLMDRRVREPVEPIPVPAVIPEEAEGGG
jgi:hypothetical protein